MKVYNLVISETPPVITNGLWGKPMEGGGFALYALYKGKWQPLKLVNDMGTARTDDDEISDISNINDMVQSEVARQLESYDESVNDTHNAPTSNSEEYPDVEIF